MKRIERLVAHAPQMRISVGKKEIEEGIAANSNHCMVAEALKKKNPLLKFIAVDIQTIRATDKSKGLRYVYLTPRPVQQMIVDFDRGKKINPFSFICRAGQVIPMNTVYGYKKKKTKRRVMKAKLRRVKDGANHSVPSIVGGKMPPKSIGQRREFGLRKIS